MGLKNFAKTAKDMDMNRRLEARPAQDECVAEGFCRNKLQRSWYSSCMTEYSGDRP